MGYYKIRKQKQTFQGSYYTWLQNFLCFILCIYIFILKLRCGIYRHGMNSQSLGLSYIAFSVLSRSWLSASGVHQDTMAFCREGFQNNREPIVYSPREFLLGCSSVIFHSLHLYSTFCIPTLGLQITSRPPKFGILVIYWTAICWKVPHYV